MTQEQQAFFKHHKIPEELTYNAQGLAINDVKERMKEEGKAFAYNSTPCENAGHTIRERSGHCAQCNTARIAFMLRSISPGCVYIAGSVVGQFIKIGSTRYREIRAESLNKSAYGSRTDWEILYSFYCIESGKVEEAIQSELKRYSSLEYYEHEGHRQQANELFRCGYPKAKEAVLKIQDLLSVRLLRDYESTQLLDGYKFRNLARAN